MNRKERMDIVRRLNMIAFDSFLTMNPFMIFQCITCEVPTFAIDLRFFTGAKKGICENCLNKVLKIEPGTRFIPTTGKFFSKVNRYKKY